MEKYIPVISALTTGVITAVSTITAVVLTQKGNKKIQMALLDQQLIRDEKKEKRNELKEILSTYSQVLRINREKELHIKVEGTNMDFDLNFYKSEIRPILFEKYYVLHDDIALSVKRIDDVIKKCNYTQKVERDDHILLNHNYSVLVTNMRQHIYNFRKERDS